MAHYQYFISPNTPSTNEVIHQLPSVSIYDSDPPPTYSLDSADLKKLFEIKFEMQGTGGRASRQPIDFSVYRRLGTEGCMKKLTQVQICNLLRGDLALKPKYLQRVKLLIEN